MIRKLTIQMLLAQVLSVLTTSLCMLVDSIVIGRFLGVGAVAAYGLSSPILLIIGGIGTILSAGVQVTCSRSIGKGLIDEANKDYSSAVGTAFIISVLFLLFVVALQRFIPTWMGAGTSGDLFDSTRGYLIGFSIGAPGCMIALVLIPFLQMAGQMALLISAVVAMTVTDVALDLLNAMVFHWGLFGMGLASAVSYYVALLVAIWYFFSRKGIFKFKFRNVSLRRVGLIFKSAIPSVFNIGTGVALVFLINKILMGLNGSIAVAAYSVITTIGNASNCISTGVYGVSLTLTGVLFQEEDKTGLKVMLKTLMPRCVFMGIGVGVLIAFFAPQLVDLFLTSGSGASRGIAVPGLRIYALGLVPCCLNNAFKGYLQGSARIKAIVNYSTAEGFLVPAIFAFALSRVSGITGVWFYFVAGEALALLGFSILKWKRAHRVSLDIDTYLDFKKGFGVPPEDMLESDLKTMDEVIAFAETAGQFCLDHGQTKITAAHVSMCIEEMAGNIILHGFSRKGRNNLSVRIQDHDGRWIIRFRDDCRAFDPLHYVFKDDAPISGIRLMMKVADEARYTYSMNLNNLMIVVEGRKS